ncbi:MAG TPA: metal-dependent hydrolase [Candidatus Bathyarchaeota archaeon]|nr:metal-dependent hydrolase [Candidatus Bathyarchaeota archaeon]
MAKIRWLGHAGFEIVLDGKIILIDPWLSGNPKAACKPSEITKADMVCVTHDHGDHMGDSIEICKRTGAVFLGTYELASMAQEKGVKEVMGFNIGGTVNVKGIDITMVQAFHTCSNGSPTGFIIRGEGKTVYHAGDTGLFGDMKLIGELYKPDVALLPIGDYYTMGALQASEAIRLIRPKIAVPMHYMTFPVLAQSADEFINLVKEKTPEVKVMVLKPGESFEF